MKKPQPTQHHLQFNLLLTDAAPAEIPADKSQELVLALAELLLNAANESLESNATTGDPHESKAD
jgi:hypothetical protein